MIETKFKESELGPIPYDWEESKICDTFLLRSNNTLSRDKLNYYYTDGIRNIHYGDILTIFGPFVTPKCKLPFINSESISNFDHLYNGDIIVADTAEDETVGKATEIVNFAGEKVVAGLHTIVLRPIASFAPIFLGYLFNSNYYHKALIPHMQGTKVTSISKKAILSTSICFPPSISEQERIAEALSDVDALIKELDALIEKKRMVLKATMQDLLTARRRLPGFSEPWKTIKLANEGISFSGLTGKSANDFGKGKGLFVTFVNVIYNTIINPNLFQKVDIRPGENQNNVIIGDILFNTSSETPEEVGMCSMVNIDLPNLYLNSFCFGYRIKSNNLDPLFLAYLLRSAIGRDIMTELAQGSTRFNLPKKKFLKTNISIPTSLTEQQAIAEILSDMDSEIAELEKKKEKYTSIRQGMMQQLLTGKIRLI